MNCSCKIYGIYLGIWVFADDILLIAPTRSTLQSMVSICENFANKFNLKFSTNSDPIKSKTKCMVFSPNCPNPNGISPIVLNNVNLPYVTEFKHLGNVFDLNNNWSKDCLLKRQQFITKLHTLRSEFHYADPHVLMKIINIYACSFPGSCLWDLTSSDVDRLYTTWNSNIRQIFKIPYNTHRYLITPISKSLHLKTMLCNRFYSFYVNIIKSAKRTVRFLAHLGSSDVMSSLGKNLSYVAKECSIPIHELNKGLIREHCRYHDIPSDQHHIVDLVLELMDTRRDLLRIDSLDFYETCDMLYNLCIS